MRTVTIVGNGRAGGSLAGALRRAGLDVAGPWGRADVDEVHDAARHADLVLLAVPDAVVETVATAVAPRAACVMAHVSGSLPLDVLGPHLRQASLHPLVSMPDARLGADRLLDEAWFAVSASDARGLADLGSLVARLGGRAFEVPDDRRTLYHAAACIASNHLVALLAQVERLGAEAGVPFEALAELAGRSLENAVALGPAAALTGPVARGDEVTVVRHLAALPADERPAYLALARLAQQLAHPNGPRPVWDTDPDGVQD